MEIESCRRIRVLVAHLPDDAALMFALRKEAEKPKVLSIKDFAQSYRQMRR